MAITSRTTSLAFFISSRRPLTAFLPASIARLPTCMAVPLVCSTWGVSFWPGMSTWRRSSGYVMGVAFCGPTSGLRTSEP